MRRPWGGARLALAAVAGAGVVAAVGATVSSPGQAPPDAAGSLERKVPAAVRPAFVPGRPRPLLDRTDATRWAPVKSATTARTRPDAAAPAVVGLSRTTPEGTTNLVAVLGHREGRDGRVWVHVRLPVLPNDRTGWVPRRSIGGYEVVHTALEIDTRALRATLRDRGRVVLRADVGVGQDKWPTPTGKFYIRNRLTDFVDPAYGPLAFGTSARSSVLTDWPGGGFIGIHGTDEPGLLPGRVSHGCVRMRNADIRALGRRMPIGTPVTIT